MKVGLGKITAIGAIAACYFLPDEYMPGQLKPVEHMFNVAKAGFQMAWVYKYSNKQMPQKHVQASTYLREALRNNGGIYIKLGQLIASLDVIVPDEYRDSMLDLTRNCHKSTFQKIKQVVQGETGESLERTFAQFDRQPISSASIGQVHKAKLITGQEAAVKVQHQNLAQNVEYDLKLMSAFVSAAKLIFKDDFKYEWLLQQFEVNIRRQLDFRLQAINMKRVEEMLKKQKFNNVEVPKLLRAPSKKLLVMEYVHGCHVDQLGRMRQMGINKEEMGKTFSKVIIKMIHKYGFVHADPHSGNILVKKDKSGGDKLVLLDHGLYQELDEKTREQYNWFWLGLILNRQDIAVRAANNLGARNGLLLCSILTSQTRQQLDSPDRNLFDLNPSKDKATIMLQAQKWRPQIINLLNEIKRQILLLLKVNQFARNIENMLGGRKTGVYEDIARCCVDNLPISTWQKLRYKWQMFLIHLRS